MAEQTAPIFEIFSGIQGEGVLTGVRQVFVRFCGCNRRCRYCDTQEACQVTPRCAVEQQPGSRRFVNEWNPLTLGQVATVVAALDAFPGLHHSVSLTGGEPLLHAEFLAALCPALRDGGLPTYLETNGTLPDALAQVLAGIDHVAMDVKLASATGEPTDWEAHRRFLELAAGDATQVKVVVTAETSADELERLAELVQAIEVGIPLVLQPVTPVAGVRRPSPMQVLEMQEALARRLPDVRVIPQVHKLMHQK